MLASIAYTYKSILGIPLEDDLDKSGLKITRLSQSLLGAKNSGSSLAVSNISFIFDPVNSISPIYVTGVNSFKGFDKGLQ